MTGIENKLWLPKKGVINQGVKNPPTNAGDMGLIPESGTFPEEVNGNPLQYSCLETRMDKGAWQATVCGITKELNMT